MMKSNERGFVILTVLLFLTLCLFVGTATDVGIWLRYRRAMQNACDAGALAGGQDLVSPLPGRDSRATAEQFARDDMTDNNIRWDALTAQAEDRNGNPDGVAPVRISVSIRATVPLFFLALVQPSVSVSVACAAQVVPALSTGLSPIGLKASTFQRQWDLQGDKPCPINLFTGPPPCGTVSMTIAPSSNGSFGSGNTGLLNMTNADRCDASGKGGANWSCVMQNGTGPSPGYQVGSLIVSATGLKVGDLNKAITAICATPAPPDPASLWIKTFPLIADADWGTISGSKGVAVAGFAAFEIDCPALSQFAFTGTNATILGEFVSVQNGVTGNPGGIDLGVDAVILVK